MRKLLQRACTRLELEIEETVSAVIVSLEEVPYAPIHGDLKPAHSIVDGDSVALIDLDKYTMADPVVDVANVLLLLPGVSPHSHLSRGEIAHTFIEEYFAHVPEAWRARLYLHYAGTLLKRPPSAFTAARRQAGPTGSRLWSRRPKIPWRAVFGDEEAGKGPMGWRRPPPSPLLAGLRTAAAVLRPHRGS